LSPSLPLRKERFAAKECLGFFGGILPEESKREIIARNLGISARNDYAMLEQIGGECAGAVTFIPAGQELSKRDYHYRKLDAKQLAGILRELPKRPLLAGEKGIRHSLAGAQDKVAVRIEGEEVSPPLDGAPSTHILKPAVERFTGVVFNERLCMTLAAHMNLPAAKVEARKIEDVEYLLVERYDRKYVTIDGAPGVEWIHQEDFCQTQNIVSELKCQKEGGPSFKQCFTLLRNVSTAPVMDLANLLDAAIFSYLIGNNDAHGMNFSLAYPDKETRLAPLYDAISTAYYPELNTDMAMQSSINNRLSTLFPFRAPFPKSDSPKLSQRFGRSPASSRMVGDFWNLVDNSVRRDRAHAVSKSPRRTSAASRPFAAEAAIATLQCQHPQDDGAVPSVSALLLTGASSILRQRYWDRGSSDAPIRSSGRSPPPVPSRGQISTFMASVGLHQIPARFRFGAAARVV
jgi:serine/threonine-protein kinase HipA